MIFTDTYKLYVHFKQNKEKNNIASMSIRLYDLVIKINIECI